LRASLLICVHLRSNFLRPIPVALAIRLDRFGADGPREVAPSERVKRVMRTEWG
jgi:hypothetical protein